jgi:hypothetical protein
VSGVNSTGFDADYEYSFIEGLVNASNGTFQSGDVVITSVTDQATTTGRKLGTDGQHSIQVTFVISVILESLQLDSSNAFSELSSALQTILQSNQLSQKINYVLQSVKGSDFVSLTVTDLISDEASSVIIPLRTASPTLSPTPTSQEDNTAFTLSGWNLVMVIVIPFFVILACLILLIATRKQNTKKMGKVAVIDVKSLSGIESDEKKEAEEEREVSVKPRSRRVPPPAEQPPSPNRQNASTEHDNSREIEVEVPSPPSLPSLDSLPQAQNPPPHSAAAPGEPSNATVPPRSSAPQRLVLPPIQSQWNANPKSLRPQQSLDLEGGGLSPLASPKKPSPRPSSGDSRKSREGHSHGHGPALHNSPAAASVDDLLKLQSDLKNISSSP